MIPGFVQKDTTSELVEAVRHYLHDIVNYASVHGDIAAIFIDNRCKLMLCEGNEGTLKKNFINKNKLNKILEKSVPIYDGILKTIKTRESFHHTKSINDRKYAYLITPILNLERKALGVLAFIISVNYAHPHTLSLLQSTVKNIEYKLENKIIEKQLYNAQQFSFSIMNNLSFGLIAIDLSDEIQWMNDTACRSINIKRRDLIHTSIYDLLPKYKEIKKEVLGYEKVNYEEYSFNHENIKEKYIFSAYPILSEKKKILGVVVTFRLFSGMMKLINKYSGNSAHYKLENIIGKSKEIKKTIQYVKKIANSPSTVLITGESGTGKEVFAQAIHNECHDRNKGGFIVINCGAISPTLIESELFGYEGGAFTGAKKEGKAGKFELANNGTLFLDEIGEMPMEMQTKLLRAIQEKSIVRVGGEKQIAINVRIIAATNKNLEDEIKKGNFREDLYYRLSVIPLRLPALRERKTDIRPLIQYFLKQKSNMLNVPMPELSAENMHRLINYNWPGNVRELENTIEKAVLFDGEIELNDFKNMHITTDDMHLDKFTTIAEMENMLIRKTLKSLENNVTKTAKTLGIGRNTLYQKMKKYTIDVV